MKLEHEKQIFCKMSDIEIMNISKTNFDDYRKSFEIIDFHLDNLLDKGMQMIDFNEIRNILRKTERDINIFK